MNDIEQAIIPQTIFKPKKHDIKEIVGYTNPNCLECSGTGDDGFGKCWCVEAWEESI